MILNGNLSQAILMLAVPVMINSFIQSMYNLTDTFWLGRIGAEYLKNCMVPGVINIPEKRRNYVDSLLDKLMFENDTPDILSTAFIKAGLVELLLFIIRCKEYEDNVIKEIDVDNRKIQEVATYIFEHYTENILLEDVADKFDMNKSFCLRDLRQRRGSGLKNILLISGYRMHAGCCWKRINLSQILLLNVDLMTVTILGIRFER